MNITEFAKSRNLKPQTVYRYISRHPEYEKHTSKNGKEVVLDSTALNMLEKKYPVPKPIELIQGVPQEEYINVLTKLKEAQKVVGELQNRLLEAQEQIATAKATELLLEDKTKRISDLEAKAEAKDSEIKAKEEEIKSLQEALATEKAKSWWDKLRGK